MNRSIRRFDAALNLFTLVELLVVVAVIAILASMLLPAISKSRHTAYNIKCVNNFKQLGIAAISYQNNNHEYQPPMRWKWDSYDCAWYGNLEFIEMFTGRKLEAYPGLPIRTLANDTGTEGLGCPLATLYKKASFNNYPLYNCYIANGYTFGNIWTVNLAVYFMPKVKNPSGKVSYLEGTNYYSSTLSVFNPAATNGYWALRENAGVSYRHQNNQAMNALFMDGHVEKVTYKEILTDPAAIFNVYN